MHYTIEEVDGTDPDAANLVRHFNAMVPEWPDIEPRHLERGYWWIIYDEDAPQGMCGMVPMTPFDGVGYMKRCYIEPLARRNGLQIRSLFTRETKARKLGWKQLISETTNFAAAANFIKAGYGPFVPEQKFGAKGSLYFSKTL